MDTAWEEHKGVPIDESLKDKWAHQALKFLIENPEEYYVYSTSGDSMVVAFKSIESDSSPTIEVYDVQIKRKICIY